MCLFRVHLQSADTEPWKDLPTKPHINFPVFWPFTNTSSAKPLVCITSNKGRGSMVSYPFNMLVTPFSSFPFQCCSLLADHMPNNLPKRHILQDLWKEEIPFSVMCFICFDASTYHFYKHVSSFSGISRSQCIIPLLCSWSPHIWRDTIWWNSTEFGRECWIMYSFLAKAHPCLLGTAS